MRWRLVGLAVLTLMLNAPVAASAVSPGGWWVIQNNHRREEQRQQKERENRAEQEARVEKKDGITWCSLGKLRWRSPLPDKCRIEDAR